MAAVSGGGHGVRTTQRRSVALVVKAKFHSAMCFEAGSKLVADRFEAGSKLHGRRQVRSGFEAGRRPSAS